MALEPALRCMSPKRKVARKQREGLYRNPSRSEAAEAPGCPRSPPARSGQPLRLPPQARDTVLRPRHPMGTAGTARPCGPRCLPPGRQATAAIKNNAWRRVNAGVRLLSFPRQERSHF